jgi:hypothetical protein
MIPQGIRVRRNFTFEPGEKSNANRFYRSLIDLLLKKRHICSDMFFDINPISYSRLEKIVKLSRKINVELMVHPERCDEYKYLMSDEFVEIVRETYGK